MGDRAIRLVAHVAEVTPKTRWIFVEVETASGLVGLGEGSLNGQDDAVLEAVRGLSGSLFAEAEAVPGPWRMPASLADAAARSAVDQALWDIAARRVGCSVAAALGGVRRRSVPLYANINRRTRDRTPAGFAASARDALAAGYDAFKIAPFDEVQPGAARVSRAVAPGLARIAATREAIGPGRDLMVDCHWRLDVAEAETVIREGEAQRLHWVECPLPETADNLPALVRLRDLANARGILLAGCELAIGQAGFEPFLQAGAYDAMMPDAKYVGGLAEMMRVSERFAAAGVMFSPHNPTGPVCHAASLQVCAASEVMGQLEVQFDETSVFAELASGLPIVTKGISVLPDGPGLGVRLRQDAVTQYRVAGLQIDAEKRP